MQKKRALSLIESLVVIALIMMLPLVVLPALYAAKANSKKVLCTVNLSGIAQALHAYTSDYDGRTHNAPNNSLWEDPDTGIAYGPGAGRAYWGVAYFPYLGTRNCFHCPSAKYVDLWYLPWEVNAGKTFEELAPIFAHSHYGLNGYVSDNNIAKFASPHTVILAQDHVETLLDSINSDMFCFGPGQSINLLQWRGYSLQYPEFYPNSVAECFRHNRSSYETYDPEKVGKGLSNTVWLDGHVSAIAETKGEDVPAAWYTGQEDGSAP